MEGVSSPKARVSPVQRQEGGVSLPLGLPVVMRAPNRDGSSSLNLPAFRFHPKPSSQEQLPLQLGPEGLHPCTPASGLGLAFECTGPGFPLGRLEDEGQSPPLFLPSTPKGTLPWAEGTGVPGMQGPAEGPWPDAALWWSH